MLEDKMNSVFQLAHLALMEEWGNMECDTSKADTERLLGLSVDDPYEICFAFLYLVEQGSLLPWLYNAPMGVLMMAARQLPWTAFAGDSEHLDEDDWDGEEDSEERITPDLSQLDTVEPLDWNEKKSRLYKLCYEDTPLYAPQESPTQGWKLNLPQLVYGMTHVLMPRVVYAYDEMAEDFCRAGMDQGLAQGMELYLQMADDSCFRVDFPADETNQDKKVETVLRDRFTEERQQLENQWKLKQQELEDRLTELTDQLRRQQEYQERLEAEKRELRGRMDDTEKQCQNKLAEKDEEVSYLKRRLSRPREHDQIAAWVEQNFSDRLILHSRAVSLLSERSARSVDTGLICDALDFLATDYWERRYRGLPTEEMNSRCGEKYGRPFDVNPTGTTTIEFTPTQYKVKYFTGRNVKPIESALDYHLGVGNDPENLLRIYFLHDDRRQLIVVGSLPRHLRSVTIR